MTTETNVQHPAKFSPAILSEISRALHEHAGRRAPRVLDPFGGVGGIHELNVTTFAIELEPEWAEASAQRGWTWCGDFFDFENGVSEFNIGGEEGFVTAATGGDFDAIVTSPTYGNRMADKHTPSAADTSRRLTYKHRLGRDLTDNNSGGMQWGPDYKLFHILAWKKCRDLLVDDGLLIINVKDHIRKGQIQRVSAWHRKVIEARGFELIEDIHVPVRGMGFGANQTLNEGLKVDYEHVFVFREVKKP